MRVKVAHNKSRYSSRQELNKHDGSNFLPVKVLFVNDPNNEKEVEEAVALHRVIEQINLETQYPRKLSPVPIKDVQVEEPEAES